MSDPETNAKRAVLFDMGSVLIGWDVRPPFRSHFESEEDLDGFLRGTFREIYDAVHDGDGTMVECLEPVRRRHPEAAHLIDIYESNWAAFITGVMEDSVAIVRELYERGVALYGLTNWPAQVWPPQSLMPEEAESYTFLDMFADIWVSGHHKLRKPDPESYQSALRRFGLVAEEVVFVDDVPANVAAAEALGLVGIQFQDAPTLRRDLEGVGLL
jgi:2-haloacid dehalogenase